MITYVDSSVLLRVVLAEPEPLREWPDIEPVSSELLRVECLRAIERYRMLQAFGDDVVAERRREVLDHLSAFRLVEPTRDVLERAAEPFPVHVATLDSIHLATALLLRSDYPDLTFATHDAKLAVAARAVGFEVAGV